ncbi:hypothetical protein [Altericroceibacterium endophyticum]|uniref:Uncharacterized protein n=1 Tax=Altericroceibacterium endophyticum TaxID=1808508 RepID=A0A6I4T642_9SPHN|nr:hypothetical protein [Altericroceibacterium endophyticum]MXO66307.1 hypothetical protein [Altericroceibacterium endophyticum]
MTSQFVLIAGFSLIGVTIVVLAILKGWQDWLALKSRELDSRTHPAEFDSNARVGGGRIEMADLKERIRRLEAIASGVDL